MSFLSSSSSSSSAAASASISPSAIGSSLSSSSSSGARKGVLYNPGKQDKKFSEIIKDTPYKHLTEVLVKYNVSINRKFLGHWWLSFEMEGSTLPNLSLEIRTPDLKSIKREIYTDKEKSTHCGIIEGTLTDILDVADHIVAKMEYYSIFTSNSQHFCNNFLHHYGFKVYRTTLGKEVTAEIEKVNDKTPEQNALIVELQQVIMKRGISEEPLQQLRENEGISDAPLQQSSRSEIEERILYHFAELLNALVGVN